MHDPLVVAFEIPAPIPRHVRYRDPRDGTRWSIERRRRTNAENLGEPIYRWWRPEGWRVVAAGRALGLCRFVTVWHVEPGGRDMGEVCKHWVDGKHKTAWKWHVWHWHLQIVPLQLLHRRLFERCHLCGRGFPARYGPISHQWDSPKPTHFWTIDSHAYHHECSALVMTRQTIEQDEALIKELISAVRVASDESEPEVIDRLCGHTGSLPFHIRYRLQGLMGFERDDNYKLVRRD
jgi:hypothetical protein